MGFHEVVAVKARELQAAVHVTAGVLVALVNPAFRILAGKLVFYLTDSLLVHVVVLLYC